MVVPGSGLVKIQAEAEGLDRIFTEAGFDWREAGCSMCLGMNPDILSPGERCASTSNRNFEGRQGPGGRTHLMSPAMAAAAAITGFLTDARKYGGGSEIPRPATPEIAIAAEPKAAAPLAPISLAQTPDAVDDGVAQSAAAPPAATSEEAMPKFLVIKGIAAPLERANVDTDLLISAKWLKTSASFSPPSLPLRMLTLASSQAHWSRSEPLWLDPLRRQDWRREPRLHSQQGWLPRFQDPRRRRRQLWLRLLARACPLGSP